MSIRMDGSAKVICCPTEMQPKNSIQPTQLTKLISQAFCNAESYEQAAACLTTALSQPDLASRLRQAAQELSDRDVMTAVREGCRGALSAAEVKQLGEMFLRSLEGGVCCAAVQAALELLDRARESQSTAELAQAIDRGRTTVTDLLSNHYYLSRDYVAKKDIRLTVEDFYSSPYKLFSAKLYLDGRSRIECTGGEELLELYHVLQSARFFLELQRDFDSTRRSFTTAKATAKSSARLVNTAVATLAPHLHELGICVCAGAPDVRQTNEPLQALRASPRIEATFSSKASGAEDACQVRLGSFVRTSERAGEAFESDSIESATLLLAKKPLLRYLASGGAELSVQVLDSSKKLPRSILEEVSAFAKTGVLLESFFGRPVEVEFCHVNLHLHILGLKLLAKR
jgi:hypothetical protein